MARFVIDIPADLNEEFRISVLKKYGSKKGALTEAITQAIRVWLTQEETTGRKWRTPIKRGLRTGPR